MSVGRQAPPPEVATGPGAKPVHNHDNPGKIKGLINTVLQLCQATIEFLYTIKGLASKKFSCKSLVLVFDRNFDLK